MHIIEFNCEQSTALERLGLNEFKNELVVQYRGRSNVYLYTDIPPSIGDELKNAKPTSLGKLIAGMKKVSKVREVSGFPKKTVPHTWQEKPRQGKQKHSGANTGKMSIKLEQRQDFSEDWLRASERREAVDSTVGVEYATLLRSTLATECFEHPHLPPHVPPPLWHRDAARPRENTVGQGASGDDNKVKIDRNYQSPRYAGRTTQVRYLDVQLECCLVDAFAASARQAQKVKDFKGAQQMWLSAWDHMLHVSISTDEWRAALLEAGNALLTMAADHDLVQVRRLLEGISILAPDIEARKEEALYRLQKLKVSLEAKLNPMWEDRDSVKAKLGTEKWENNPAPKMDYAARRREWEDELKKVNELINFIVNLNFRDLGGRGGEGAEHV